MISMMEQKRSNQYSDIMKKVFVIAALVILASCVKEASEETNLIFEGGFDEVDTRVQFTPYASYSKIEWDVNDLVNIFVVGRSYQYTAEQAGTYSRLIPVDYSAPVEARYYALYPYDPSAVITGNVVRTELPAVQIAEENSLSAHLSVAETGSSNLFFRNVCGLFRVRISEGDIEKIVFRGNNNEIVAGKIDVAVSSDPTWTSAGGSTSVTLKAPDNGTFAEGDYYMAVLPQTFKSGVTVTAYKTDGTTVVKPINASKTLRRGGVLGGEFIDGQWEVDKIIGKFSGTDQDLEGIGENAQMINPQDIVLAPDGSYWITVRNVHSIWKMTVQGTQYTLSRMVVTNSNDLLKESFPWGGDFDSSGKFYVALKGKGKVVTYTAGGSVEEYPISGAASLSNVMKVLVGNNDLLYVFARVSADNGVVYEVEDGVVKRQWRLTTSLYETMCFNADESALFVFPNNSGNIMMINLSDGTTTHVAGTGVHPTDKKYYTDGIPGYPHTTTIGTVEGAICAPDGTIYFSDNSARTIRKFYPDSKGDYSKGTIETVAGKVWNSTACDGVGLSAAFAYPSGVALAPDGTLYVIDGTNMGTVRKISYIAD